MKQVLSFIVFFVMFLAQAKAQNIVALVNDNPITSHELESRQRMLMIMNNIRNPDPKTIKELNDYALQTLIDDSILAQHAIKVGGRVSEEEIIEAISSIEKRNNLPAGQLIKSFSDKAIEKSFKAQIKTELIKMNILSYISKSITVSPKEINSAILTSDTKDLKVIAKVFISREKDVKSLTKMNNLRKKIKNCNNVAKADYEKFASMIDIDENISSLDSQIRTIIKDLDLNQMSKVFETTEGFKIAMVCNKEFSNVTSEDNTYITNFLTNKKMSLKAQKFFDALRKKTYIKIFNS